MLTSTLPIKNVPTSGHDEIRRRARDRGVTVRYYLLELIR